MRIKNVFHFELVGLTEQLIRGQVVFHRAGSGRGSHSVGSGLVGERTREEVPLG